MRSLRWISVGLVVVGVVALVRYLIERQESAALRSEIALLQQEQHRVTRLRAENERLVAGKVSDAELQRLRNDRAALNRLRNEINVLETNAEQRAKAIQEPPAGKAAQRLILSVGSDGALVLNDAPVDQNSLRPHLAKLIGKTEWVEVWLRVAASNTSRDVIKSTMEAISDLGKELGVKVSFRLDSGTR
jgi:biopolymer transport protein ExbD